MLNKERVLAFFSELAIKTLLVIFLEAVTGEAMSL